MAFKLPWPLYAMFPFLGVVTLVSLALVGRQSRVGQAGPQPDPVTSHAAAPAAWPLTMSTCVAS